MQTLHHALLDEICRIIQSRIQSLLACCSVAGLFLQLNKRKADKMPPKTVRTETDNCSTVRRLASRTADRSAQAKSGPVCPKWVPDSLVCGYHLRPASVDTYLNKPHITLVSIYPCTCHRKKSSFRFAPLHLI